MSISAGFLVWQVFQMMIEWSILFWESFCHEERKSAVHRRSVKADWRSYQIPPLLWFFGYSPSCLCWPQQRLPLLQLAVNTGSRRHPIEHAETIFPEQFALDYEKYVIESELSLGEYDCAAPPFELCCSLPNDLAPWQDIGLKRFIHQCAGTSHS